MSLQPREATPSMRAARIYRLRMPRSCRTSPRDGACDLCEPRRRSLERLDQRLRRERLCEIGETSGLKCSLANGGVVVPSHVDDRRGNSRSFEPKPQLDGTIGVRKLLKELLRPSVGYPAHRPKCHPARRGRQVPPELGPAFSPSPCGGGLQRCARSHLSHGRPLCWCCRE